MGRLESPLEAWCVKWARVRGIVVAKLAQVDGIPDRVFFLPGGRPLIVEFKGRKKRGKDLQEKTQPWYIAKLRQDGYEAHCCDTREQFLELLEGSVITAKGVTDALAQQMREANDVISSFIEQTAARAREVAVSAPKSVLDCAPGTHVYKYGRRYVVKSVEHGTALVELDEHDQETITRQTAGLWETKR